MSVVTSVAVDTHPPSPVSASTETVGIGKPFAGMVTRPGVPSFPIAPSAIVSHSASSDGPEKEVSVELSLLSEPLGSDDEESDVDESSEGEDSELSNSPEESEPDGSVTPTSDHASELKEIQEIKAAFDKWLKEILELANGITY